VRTAVQVEYSIASLFLTYRSVEDSHAARDSVLKYLYLLLWRVDDNEKYSAQEAVRHKHALGNLKWFPSLKMRA
jgi:hypothetical protein